MNYNRPILKRKLAQLYYPDCSVETARRKFRAEIQKMPGLAKALSKAGYNPNDKQCFFFSPPNPNHYQILTGTLKEKWSKVVRSGQRSKKRLYLCNRISARTVHTRR